MLAAKDQLQASRTARRFPTIHADIQQRRSIRQWRRADQAKDRKKAKTLSEKIDQLQKQLGSSR
jgi:hypothetical protein